MIENFEVSSLIKKMNSPFSLTLKSLTLSFDGIKLSFKILLSFFLDQICKIGDQFHRPKMIQDNLMNYYLKIFWEFN